jgi:hypothetical protein
MFSSSFEGLYGCMDYLFIDRKTFRWNDIHLKIGSSVAIIMINIWLINYRVINILIDHMSLFSNIPVILVLMANFCYSTLGHRITM